MFKIGEFSKLVQVSPRMLRHYEKCGLLYPAEIDRFTGYRTYSARQIPLLINIVALRDMGFSIEEIGDILPRFDDIPYMERVLQAKMVQTQGSIEAEQERMARLKFMDSTIREGRINMVYDVELKDLPPVKVLSLRKNIDSYDEEGGMWHRIGSFIGQHEVAAQSGGYSIYHDEEYTEENVDVEVAIPVMELGEAQGDFVYKELEGIPCAATIRFAGPYDGGYPAAMEKLGSWVEENNYSFAGNIRGFGIVSPSMENDPEKFLTELQVPVVKK